MIGRPYPLLRNIGIVFSLCITIDDVGEVFQKVMSDKRGEQGRMQSSLECDTLPPKHDHKPRDHHGRPNDLQNHQDRLLPGGERAQVQRYQTRPGHGADANEQRVDEFYVDLSVRSPKDNSPNQRRQEAA